MLNELEDWDLLQRLFHLAESAPESSREQILDQQGVSPDLKQRVLRMVQGAELPPARSRDQPVAGKLGPYTLIRHIGAGGIGSVYLAERLMSGVPQRAALKVLAPHAAGPSFIERFHREQHILASLNHPHITRLLDAGVAEGGQPYLVMEYVDGVHFDDFCDARSLGVRERIALFLQICDAVAYAHRNLIVHLDLKPSNILVDGQGSVKLLDFGTSKLIHSGTLLTTTMLATPAYASPEQLRNEPVTTSCDVYSLGAILFDLLAGRRSAGKLSAALMFERAISEAEPENMPAAVTDDSAKLRGLSAARLRQVLAGDLETITNKCLRPRPKDRYPSVDALADDLKRYLAGRAVLAQPQTTFYRVSKFVRRNRASVAWLTLVLIALVASVGYAAWRQQQAINAGRRAMQMQAFMYRLFKLANSNYTGKPAATVPEFLALGARILPDYIKNPADLRQAQLGLAESMYETGDLDSAQKLFTQVAAEAKAENDIAAQAESEAFSGNIHYLNGEIDPGAALTANALKLSRQPGIPPSVRVWSAIYYAWGRDNNGFRSDENLSLLRYAVKEARRSNLSNRETADALFNLAEDLELRGLMQEAQDNFNQSLRLYGSDPAALCEQSAIYGELAFIKQQTGDLPGSAPLYRKAYDGYKTCSGPQSRGALTQQEFLAGVLLKTGSPEQALSMMEQAMPLWRKMLGTGPDLSEPLNFMILAELANNRFPQAEQHAAEMVAIQTGKVAATDRRFGVSHLLWARALIGQGRYREALPHAEIADRLLAMNAISAGAKQAGAEAHALLLDVQAKLQAQGSAVR
jgi:serine/threonine-protein kinase